MDYRKALEQGFRNAPFVAHLGIELEAIGPGWCEAGLALQPWQLQQTGVAHAGVVATLADHCAGAAATRGSRRASSSSRPSTRSTCCGARAANACTAVPRC